MPRKDLPPRGKATPSGKGSQLPPPERDGNKEQPFIRSSKNVASAKRVPEEKVPITPVVIKQPTKASCKEDDQKIKQAASKTYPDPVYAEFDKKDEKPGFWANRAAKSPWDLGSKDLRQPDTLLNKLCKMPLKREPTLQADTEKRKRAKLNGEEWNAQIGHHKAQIEALIVQAVGQRLSADSACERCLLFTGKFNACVTIPGVDGCANCRWDLQGKKCRSANQDGKKPTWGLQKQNWAPQKQTLDQMLVSMQSLDTMDYKKPLLNRTAQQVTQKKRVLAQEILEEAERLGCL
ncbi:unnamed protein product [Penicillium bialowiezense]